MKQRHVHARGAVNAAKLSPAARAYSLGPDPSLSNLLTCMDRMGGMAARQSAVESAALECVTYQTSVAELTEIAQYFRGAPLFLLFRWAVLLIADACKCKVTTQTPDACTLYTLCSLAHCTGASVLTAEECVDSPEVDNSSIDLVVRQVQDSRDAPTC